MEISLTALFVIVIILLAVIVGTSSSKRKVYKNGVYKYTPKDSLMTRSEGEFYWKLYRIVEDRYFLFPQVHLSSLLDHRVKGQDWKHAFRHINGKSVDYVLCSKVTLQPMYAIELDDDSHNRPDRIKRDIEVERVFDEANIPLVRLRNYKSLTERDIADSLAKARALSNTKVQ